MPDIFNASPVLAAALFNALWLMFVHVRERWILDGALSQVLQDTIAMGLAYHYSNVSWAIAIKTIGVEFSLIGSRGARLWLEFSIWCLIIAFLLIASDKLANRGTIVDAVANKYMELLCIFVWVFLRKQLIAFPTCLLRPYLERKRTTMRS